MHALPVFLAFDLNNLLLFVYFPHCYGSCYYVKKRRCSCYILWFLYIHKNSWAFLFSTANSRFVCFPHLKHTDLFNMKNYTIFNSADSLDVLNFADGAAGGPFCPFSGKISMRKHACHTCLRLFVFSDFFRYLNNNMKCIGFVTRTRRSQSDRKKSGIEKNPKHQKILNQRNLCKTLFQNTNKSNLWDADLEFTFFFLASSYFKMKIDIPQLLVSAWFSNEFSLLISHPEKIKAAEFIRKLGFPSIHLSSYDNQWPNPNKMSSQFWGLHLQMNSLKRASLTSTSQSTRFIFVLLSKMFVLFLIWCVVFASFHWMISVINKCYQMSFDLIWFAHFMITLCGFT